jgi:hypothetical protein
LSQEDVELAIQLVLTEGANVEKPRGLIGSASRLLEANADYAEYRSGHAPASGRRVSDWYLQDFDERRAVAGLQRGGYAMSVELAFDAEQVRIRPTEATPNLHWDGGDRIHKGAIHWTLELSTAIRHEPGTMKGYRLQHKLERPRE